MTDSVLNLYSVDDGFQNGIKGHIRQFAEVVNTAGGRELAKRQVAALNQFHEYLSSIDLPRDQRIRSLELIQGYLGKPKDGLAFSPSPSQHKLFSWLGNNEGPPPSSRILDELVSAGISDLLNALSSRVAEQVKTEADRIEETWAPWKARAEAAEAHADQVEVERDAFQAEVKKLTRQRAYFRELMGPRAKAKPRVKASASTRTKPANKAKASANGKAS